MTINVLIIGSGKMAQSYIETIRQFNNFNILGIYSRNQKNLKIFCEINKVIQIKNFNEIKRNKIHLLIIAVTAPNLLNVIKLTRNLKCVRLLEKPLGISLSQAKQIKKIANKKKYFLALNRRMYESTIFAKKIIKKNKVIYIEDHINFDYLKKCGFNLKQKENFIYSHSIHLIDYFNIFTKSKILEIKRNKFKLNNDNFLFCTIRFSSGDIGIYTAHYNSKKKWKIIIFEKNNTIKFQPLENAKLYSNKKIFTFHPINHDKYFKPGIYKIIFNLNLLFKKRKYELTNMNEALKLMNLINKIHF